MIPSRASAVYAIAPEAAFGPLLAQAHSKGDRRALWARMAPVIEDLIGRRVTLVRSRIAAPVPPEIMAALHWHWGVPRSCTQAALAGWFAPCVYQRGSQDPWSLRWPHDPAVRGYLERLVSEPLRGGAVLSTWPVEVALSWQDWGAARSASASHFVAFPVGALPALPAPHLLPAETLLLASDVRPLSSAAAIDESDPQAAAIAAVGAWWLQRADPAQCLRYLAETLGDGSGTPAPGGAPAQGRAQVEEWLTAALLARTAGLPALGALRDGPRR